jgi:hypothetical protein
LVQQRMQWDFPAERCLCSNPGSYHACCGSHLSTNMLHVRDGQRVHFGCKCPANIWHDDAGGVVPPLLDGKLLMRMPEARFRLLLPGDASCGTQLYKVSCQLHGT